METSDQQYTNEEQLIDDKFQELLNGYLNSNHRKKVEIIERAFKFAKEAHKGIRRRSGEPYILHPIAVARIVSHEIGLGSTSICAALLHDVVEDTEYTVEDIENHFGKKIASIVDGLTKISGGIFGDQASAQAENFRRLLLTMSEDIRVILIKMADRLHNMRTLGSMLPSKQYKIAGETLYIYAPLAHRLGLFAIKTELEDLAFKYEHPEPNAIDFLDTIKLNLFSTEIFVFTPKGELITLPKDATALDLAFTLHSDLGFHCIAAKVNHRLVPLNQKLHSGDQVEILTSKSQTPKEEWLNFITTAKARSRLTASLRKDRRKIIAKGEKILKDFFESNHIEYNNDVVTKILSNLGIRHRDDLFYKIGNDEITPNENIKKIIKGKSQNPFMRYLKLSFGSNNGKNEQPKPVTPQQLTIDRKQTYILRDENGVKNYKVADCCCPIPGDDVLGYVEDDETVVVHKRECPVAMRLKSSFGPRLVSTQWEASESLSFPAKIEIQGIDRIGILNEITRVISNELIIDMRGLTIKANEGVFTGTVDIMVHDTRVVESLCNKLRKIKGVQKVARCKE